MSERASDRLKASFVDARLSLFQVRMLNELENARGGDAGNQVERLVGDVATKSGESATVPLLNQTSFLSHAYMSLVWLHEVVKQEVDGTAAQVIESWFTDCVDEVLADGGVHVPECGVKTRQVKRKKNELLRTLRNAISHSGVDFRGNRTIEFTDDHRGYKSTATLRWEHLGYLADSYIFAVSNLIYGQPSERSPLDAESMKHRNPETQTGVAGET